MGKILILANNDIGLYKFRKELIQELINKGNDLYISLPDGELVKNIEKMGAKFVNTPLNRRGINPVDDLKLIFRYFKLINQVRPDFIITYTIKPNIYGGIVSKIKKIPYAINITGLGSAFQKDSFLKKMVISLYRVSCNKAAIVFFENEENQNTFIEKKIINKEKTFKLNGAGVNLEEYELTDYPAEDVLHFLFIGRVMKEKGVDELFHVAKKIKRENKNKNIIFNVVGLIEDDYEEVIRDLEKQGVIKYYGFQKDVKPFIAKSHCFVLPSYHEGMANTLLEAAAMGRPLITSNIYGCKEAVIDGESGYLVNVKDEDDLYKKLKSFIHVTHEEKEKMGRKSREHIEKVFDKKKVVKLTIEKIKI